MNQDLSIVQLVINASFVVQIVMLLLLAVSVASWAAIFRKLRSLKGVRELNDDFERSFWSGTSLNELFSAAAQNAKSVISTIVREAGRQSIYQEFSRRVERGDTHGTERIVVTATRLPL